VGAAYHVLFILANENVCAIQLLPLQLLLLLLLLLLVQLDNALIRVWGDRTMRLPAVAVVAIIPHC